MQVIVRYIDSDVARNLIWGGGIGYVLTSHCNFKTCVKVPHVNKTVTDLGVYIPRYLPPLLLRPCRAENNDQADYLERANFIVSATTEKDDNESARGSPTSDVSKIGREPPRHIRPLSVSSSSRASASRIH